jgi:signal transduction histidine kinase
VKRRVLLSIVAAAALAVVLFGVPLAVAVGRLYRSQELTRLDRAATGALRAVPAGGPTGPDPIELPRPGAGVRLAVYDPAGRRAGGAGAPSAGPAARRALAGRPSQGTENEALVASVPVVDDEQVVGAIQASASIEVVEARTHRTWLLMVGLGLVALGVAAAVGWRQARRLATPVRALAATAAQLGDGDFGARAARSGVPELDDAAAALNVTASRLGDLVERERAFSADASHQLRTPLTALRLMLESALENPGADARASIAQAVNEVDRLHTTIEELLALARDAPHPRAPVDLVSLVADVDARWHGRLAAAGRPLRTVAESDLPTVVASSPAVRHVVEVLVDNAVAHGRGAVVVQVRRAAAGVAVEVSDEGEGVGDGAGDVFARRSASDQGHGIGLSLARSLAEAEGGELVLSRAAPNPVFALFLPGSPTGDR